MQAHTSDWLNESGSLAQDYPQLCSARARALGREDLSTFIRGSSLVHVTCVESVSGAQQFHGAWLLFSLSLFLSLSHTHDSHKRKGGEG